MNYQNWKPCKMTIRTSFSALNAQFQWCAYYMTFSRYCLYMLYLQPTKDKSVSFENSRIASDLKHIAELEVIFTPLWELFCAVYVLNHPRMNLKKPIFPLFFKGFGPVFVPFWTSFFLYNKPHIQWIGKASGRSGFDQPRSGRLSSI